MSVETFLAIGVKKPYRIAFDLPKGAQIVSVDLKERLQDSVCWVRLPQHKRKLTPVHGRRVRPEKVPAMMPQGEGGSGT